MHSSEILKQYLPELNEDQLNLYKELDPLYKSWNEKINVISRKDIDNLYKHHILHSLAISKYINFKEGTKILDLGTGGGFPGIPLAIRFPECDFHLIDATRKKITVVQNIVEELNLKNVKATHTRAEELTDKYEFVVTRAVAPVVDLFNWSKRLMSSKHKNFVPNGIFCLKGGNVKKELKELGKKQYYEMVAIEKYFNDPYFEEKYIIYIQG
jgi:16S rRNA (guanine527-N7)-methyltransferase